MQTQNVHQMHRERERETVKRRTFTSLSHSVSHIFRCILLYESKIHCSVFQLSSFYILIPNWICHIIDYTCTEIKDKNEISLLNSIEIGLFICLFVCIFLLLLLLLRQQEETEWREKKICIRKWWKKYRMKREETRKIFRVSRSVLRNDERNMIENKQLFYILTVSSILFQIKFYYNVER